MGGFSFCCCNNAGAGAPFTTVVETQNNDWVTAIEVTLNEGDQGRITYDAYAEEILGDSGVFRRERKGVYNYIPGGLIETSLRTIFNSDISGDTLSVRERRDGNLLQLQIRGANNENWRWEITGSITGVTA